MQSPRLRFCEGCHELSTRHGLRCQTMKGIIRYIVVHKQIGSYIIVQLFGEPHLSLQAWEFHGKKITSKLFELSFDSARILIVIFRAHNYFSKFYWHKTTQPERVHYYVQVSSLDTEKSHNKNGIRLEENQCNRCLRPPLFLPSWDNRELSMWSDGREPIDNIKRKSKYLVVK